MDDALLPMPQSHLRQMQEKLHERAVIAIHASPMALQKREWKGLIAPVTVMDSAA